MKSRRLAAFAVLLASVGGLTACGNKQDRTTNGETEGAYVDVGPLKYQVQISRQLNPSIPEDADYLVGLPEGVTTAPDEIWFAIFMRVENDGDAPRQAASDFTITDTLDDTFRPVALSKDNVFAYRPQLLQPAALIPDPNSAAGEGPTQGSLILFKLKTPDLQNRPLILHINEGGASGESTSVEIDL
jgi:hypothetical protein